MNTTEKLKILCGFNEEQLIDNVVIPLLGKMGFKNIVKVHGQREKGLDLLFYKMNEFKEREYAGAQVKAEKIHGSSSKPGNATEIFNQAHQAFLYSFPDVYDSTTKNIDKYIVMTSGDINTHARDLIKDGLETMGCFKVIHFFDGEKLVGLIDEYIPSFFWKEYDHFYKYFHAMKSAFETITDITAIGQKEPIPLEDIYVSLKLREKREQKILEGEKVKEMDEKVEEKHWVEPSTYMKETIFDADAVTKKFDKVVIMGGPGSGKTTLLKHLTLKFCRKNLETQKRKSVPIFMMLRQFLESGKSVREYINEVFEQYDFPKAKEFIEKDLKEGICQLFLDGFDELASKERQQMVTEKIERFVRDYPQNQVIVTSRTAGYHGELKGFETLEVQPFDDHQIEQFITNWFGEIDPEKAQAMGEAIKDNEKIKELASNPLMIAIIAVIYEEDKQLPQRRVKLYERCLDVLLSKWDIKKKIRNKYDAEAKQKILRKLALETHSQGERSFTKEELLKKFNNYLPEVRIDPERAEDVLNEIVQRNVLLKEISIDVYEFLHLSFQEYLTALELREKKDYENLLSNLYEPWWEEVVLLFAGFDRDAAGLIKEMKEKEGADERFREDIFCSNLMLMGKCIADADFTDVAIREEIVNDLWELYQTGEFSSLRDKAMEILALIKPASIVDSLLEELKDEDSGVRGSAAIALGKIGHERAVDQLVDALKDEDSGVRERAAYALGEIGHERAVDPLVDALKDEDSGIRGRAAEALGKIGPERAVDQLVDALKDEDSGIRGSAAEALGKIGHERAVDQLVDALKDEDSFVRERAAEALGKIGPERAVDQLVDALKDEDSGIRGRAAEALGKIGHERAVDQLVDALKDEDSFVRERAAEALGEIGHERAVDQLVEALKDENSDVRWRAAEALGEIGHEKAVDPLVNALKDENSSVRWRAAFALGEIGHERAVDPLVNALKDENSSVRESAAEALGEIGHERAVDPLVKALKDENSSVRWSAAGALGEIGHEKAVDPLKKALKDEGVTIFGKVKDAAFTSLEKISRESKIKIVMN